MHASVLNILEGRLGNVVLRFSMRAATALFDISLNVF